MATMYDDVEAICPYFLRSGAKKVVCEGMHDYSIGLEFDHKEERNKHRETYCNTYEYGRCQVCQIIERKYS